MRSHYNLQKYLPFRVLFFFFFFFFSVNSYKGTGVSKRSFVLDLSHSTDLLFIDEIFFSEDISNTQEFLRK